MRKIIFLSLLASSAIIASEFGVEVGVQQNKLDAEFAYGDSSTRTEVTDEELGLKSSDNVIKPRIYYKSGNHTFDFDFEGLDFSGSNTLTKTVVFDDKTYNVGTNVDTTFEMDWYRLGYRYSFLSNEKSNLNIGLDLHIIDASVSLDADSLNLSSSYSETLPMPTLVIDGNYAINNKIGVEAKVSGITAGSKATYTEFYAGLNAKCLMIKNGTWRLGYQYKKFDIDIDDFDGEISYKGAYLGFNYKF